MLRRTNRYRSGRHTVGLQADLRCLSPLNCCFLELALFALTAYAPHQVCGRRILGIISVALDVENRLPVGATAIYVDSGKGVDKDADDLR